MIEAPRRPQHGSQIAGPGAAARILITGGAGFVGSDLAMRFRATGAEVHCLDNLRRRGSETNLARFKRAGVQFHHGDIRNPSDLADLPGEFDLFIECSAEPSVLAGLTGSPRYLIDSNLTGTLNCLEYGRARAGAMVFLSTSRVYSIRPLRELRLDETATRLALAERQASPGVSRAGIAEDFPVGLPRSLYGATKLASELFVQEYADTYAYPAVINRCGVIAGPGQFGKVDQGVFTLWVARHYFKGSLKYTGFGGQGKQVRDLLHPEDLFALIQRQATPGEIAKHRGSIWNIGGGLASSCSLLELTRICEEVTGNSISIASDLTTSPVDIPYYVTDTARAKETWGWQPRHDVRRIVQDIAGWIRENEAVVGPLFA